MKKLVDNISFEDKEKEKKERKKSFTPMGNFQRDLRERSLPVYDRRLDEEQKYLEKSVEDVKVR